MADKQKAAAAARLRKSAAAATEQLDEAGASKAALRFAEAAASAAASGVTLEGVNGFFEPGFLPVLHAIDAAQRHAEVHGAVGEIGVYHGKSFVPLALVRRPSERAVAVDCFADQHFNQDQSGIGDESQFLSTLRSFGCDENLEIIRCDSTALSAAQLRAAADGPLRIISIDGSHTEHATASDLALAAEAISDGGVVILDDALNTDWPGVISGLAKHVYSGGKLRPVALGYNKCVLVRAEWTSVYAKALAHFKRKSADLLGHEVLVMAAGWIAVHFANDAPLGRRGSAAGASGDGALESEALAADASAARGSCEARRRRMESAGAGYAHVRVDAAAENAEEQAWHLKWQRRLECWFVALPLPTQTQLGSCFGALSLHLASRFETAWRNAQAPLGGMGRVAEGTLPQGATVAAEPGCEWLEDHRRLQLPDFPELTGVPFTLPPLPRLLPKSGPDALLSLRENFDPEQAVLPTASVLSTEGEPPRGTAGASSVAPVSVLGLAGAAEGAGAALLGVWCWWQCQHALRGMLPGMLRNRLRQLPNGKIRDSTHFQMPESKRATMALSM